ncbi:immunity 22 family protein [Paenibacillus durus]|uniref:Immunity protein 22 n=1 Tax=Paenibacillus durus TaxID=44251 RepID=A0A089HWK8_PAEDU|nr:immunity 22 family protein [Paenibacillus durus]AIQ15180.1 hypothetical protein PDUR_27470 [Paenibacillus durus]
MEKEGIVSLWVGSIKSDNELMKYVTLIYDQEGECLPSQFIKDFNIDMDEFDEYFIERVFHEKELLHLDELIAGCSYEDIVIPNYITTFGNGLNKGTNCAILLYNFEYNSINTNEISNNNYSFKYIGSVKYNNQ